MFVIRFVARESTTKQAFPDQTFCDFKAFKFVDWRF